MVNIEKNVEMINSTLTKFIEKLSHLNSIPIYCFNEWKFNFICNFKQQYYYIKKFRKNFFDRKLVFFDLDLLAPIKELKDKFVITSVDKAASNFSVI